MDFAAKFCDSVPHCLNHIDQDIGSNMGLLLPENVFRRPELHKCLKDKPVSPFCVFHKRVQLSVRERARAALTELYIGIRIQDTCLPETLHIFLSLSDRSAPFNNQRRVSLLCQKIPTEQPCRSASDHNRSAGCSLRPVLRSAIGRFRHFSRLSFHPPQNRLFILHSQVNRIDVVKFRLFPRVKRPFPDVVLLQFLFLDI